MNRIEVNVQTGEQKVIPLTADEIAAIQAEPVHIPQTITSFQAKAALLNAGLLDTVEAFMVTAPAFAKLAWKEAPTFERNSPTLKAMAQALFLADDQLDSLFTYGAGVKA